jgi:hypothetical protein
MPRQAAPQITSRCDRLAPSRSRSSAFAAPIPVDAAGQCTNSNWCNRQPAAMTSTPRNAMRRPAGPPSAAVSPSKTSAASHAARVPENSASDHQKAASVSSSAGSSHSRARPSPRKVRGCSNSNGQDSVTQAPNRRGFTKPSKNMNGSGSMPLLTDTTSQNIDMAVYQAIDTCAASSSASPRSKVRIRSDHHRAAMTSSASVRDSMTTGRPCAPCTNITTRSTPQMHTNARNSVGAIRTDRKGRKMTDRVMPASCITR